MSDQKHVSAVIHPDCKLVYVSPVAPATVTTVRCNQVWASYMLQWWVPSSETRNGRLISSAGSWLMPLSALLATNSLACSSHLHYFIHASIICKSFECGTPTPAIHTSAALRRELPQRPEHGS